jgi:chromosome segregation ATPase
LINPAICRDWLANSIPPGEQVYVQEKQDTEISDFIATSMASLFSHSVEAMRRSEINQIRVSKLSIDCIRMKDELADAKKQIEQLTLTCAQEVTNHEATEAKLSSADELLAKEVTAREELELKWSQAESGLAEERKLFKQSVEEKTAEIHRLKLQLSETENTHKKDKAKLLKKHEEERARWEGERSKLKSKARGLRRDKKWILEKGVSLTFRALKGSKEYNDALHTLTARADAVGRLEGMQDGYKCA